MENLLSIISTEDLGPYEPDLDISCALKQLAKVDPLRCVWLAYHYGFQMAQTAAKENAPASDSSTDQGSPTKTN